MTTRRLAVMYDKGSVHPAEVARALDGVAVPVFGVADSAEARRLLPVMEHLGLAVQLGAGHRDDVRLLAKAAPDGIVTFSERMIPATCAVAEDLGLAYHSPQVAAVLTSKLRQRAALAAAGVDGTACAPVRDEAGWDAAVAAVGLPAVLKPAWGGGSRDTYLVREPAAGRAAARAVLDRDREGLGCVLEAYLPGRDSGRLGDYVSVETMHCGGGFRHVAVTGKFALAPPFRETGQFWPALLDPADTAAVLDLVTAALRAVGVTTGITHTEVKLTPDGPRILEVNGRLGGHLHELGQRAAGADLVRVAGLLALGESPQPPAITPDRVYWQYNNPAPVRPCRFIAASGWREARLLPGVTRYTPYVRDGDAIAGGVMTSPLDLVCGEAADHDRMLGQIDEVSALLSFAFEIDGERVDVPAKALPDC